MLTRATVGGQRVTVWQYNWQNGRKYWAWKPDKVTAARGGAGYGLFPTMELAIASAQATLGPDVCIVQHTAPTRAEGGA